MMARLTDIITAACELASMSRDGVVSARRWRPYFVVRTAISVIAVEHGYSRSQIGKALGRDHSSIVHVLKIRDVTERHTPWLPSLIEALRDECDGMPFGGWDSQVTALDDVPDEPREPEPVEVIDEEAGDLAMHLHRKQMTRASNAMLAALQAA